MTTLVPKAPDGFERFADRFRGCPALLSYVRDQLGDSGRLVTWWVTDDVDVYRRLLKFLYSKDGKYQTGECVL